MRPMTKSRSPLTLSSRVSFKELYDKYHDEHPEKYIHPDHFRRVIGHALVEYRSQMLEGKVLNIGLHIGKMFVRKCKRRFDLYVIDYKNSNKNKEDIYGCAKCPESKQGRGPMLVCSNSGKIIYYTICHKQPELAKSKKNWKGKPWVVPHTEDSYFHCTWNMASCRIKNHSVYKFQTQPQMKKLITKIPDLEYTCNNK
jgi:hypothetical protein